MQYRFRITKLSGALHSERFHNCITDDHAMAVARMMLDPTISEYRVEVRRGDACIYNGVPSSWPFKSVRKTANLRVVPNDNGDPPPRVA